MSQASATERVQASVDQMYRVITDYNNYPKFLPMCKEAHAERESETSVKVSYVLDLFTKVVYTVQQTEDPVNKSIRWTTLESNIFTKNDGGWKLREVAPGITEAKYDLELEFKVPVPGFILKKLVQVSLPEMMKAFIKKAEADARAAKK